MMVSTFIPCVMQVVIFYKKFLGCKHLFFNMVFIALASVLAFSGTFLGERVRAREWSPIIGLFRARKCCFQTKRRSPRWDCSTIGTVTGCVLLLLGGKLYIYIKKNARDLVSGKFDKNRKRVCLELQFTIPLSLSSLLNSLCSTLMLVYSLIVLWILKSERAW
jgi:4-hydroxybenzoate polyprenyltransferase